MLNKTFQHSILLTAVLVANQINAAPAYAGEISHGLKSSSTTAYCGHEEHDNLELRKQAATKTFWRDDRAANPKSWTRFKILGFNDFHGQLEAASVSGRPAGGAELLAAYLRAANKAAENGALIVHTGDHVGASPPVSALLHDEPSITFLNMLANEVCYEDEDGDENEDDHGRGRHQDHKNGPMNPECNLTGTLGNHEFDEGVDEMLRLVNGGIHQDGPFLDSDYSGAKFPYVIANVVFDKTGKTVLPPYVIKRVKGMPVAFIGAVLKQTPSIVTPTGVAGVSFLDEADAINSYVPELKRKGVRAIVVTIHQGARQTYFSGPTQEGPEVLNNSISDIINRLDDEIDIVVSGHAHGFTNQLAINQNGKQILVTQAFSRGTAYADIDVAIDPRTRDIVEKSASIITTYGDDGVGLIPQPDVAALVADAVNAVAPLVNQIIGNASNDITRTENAAGESQLGNLISDAQRQAMGTNIAFMNPGGIRADISAGEVTWGDVFTIQPFNNDLVKMDLSGQQIVNLLNQQWDGQSFPRIMKPSGISYTWNASNPTNDRVVVASIMINGAPIALDATYTVTVNSFMAAGGDNFSILTEGTNRIIGPVDLDALVDFIESLPQPFNYNIDGRVQRIN